MNSGRSIALSTAFLLAALASSTRTAAQSPAPPRPSASTEPQDAETRTHKSAYGKLESIIASRNGVIMKTDAGARLAWKFDAPVIAELAKFKPGDPMIVIYRQISPSDRRVTAVAFPGTAKTPTYIRVTGWGVALRSSPMVGGVCSQAPGAAPVSESIIPSDGRAEVLEACWCCAPSGETCTPSNKSGLGQAFLVKCFQ
ncbi:MAG TPA: hypothetical protein PKU70_08135 [Vicinamibacteria bacterium]|nr:hypothetical protein [Vicinamibacteria bacterium]